MSELEIHFERLMEFAKSCNFHKPFSEIHFVEENSIRRFHKSDKNDEISYQDVFKLEDYEKRFELLLKRKHSWINMNFAGVLDNTLLIVIEFPNYENNADFTSVNLSLPSSKVIENDWNISSFVRII